MRQTDFRPVKSSTTPPTRTRTPTNGGTGIECQRSAETCSGPASITFSLVVQRTPSYDRAAMPITISAKAMMVRVFMDAPSITPPHPNHHGVKPCLSPASAQRYAATGFGTTPIAS